MSRAVTPRMEQPIDGKPLIHVAAGVLQDAQGRVLMAQRPEGKIAAGYWEFPGGKIEPGETAREALARELAEELGVQVLNARPLIRFRHEYSNRSVILDTWLVSAFQGEVESRERQSFAWAAVGELVAWPQVLPTVAPITAALRLPSQYVFTPPGASAAEIRRGLRRLPAGALLRLRAPQLDDVAYQRYASELRAAVREAGLGLVLDRDPEQALALGAQGWHATSRRLAELQSTLGDRVPPLRLVSCHDAAELKRALQLGFTAAVLGPVQATSSHPGQPALGWPVFTERVQGAGLPVYALGGLGPQHLDQAFAAYAQGVAGISAYWSEPVPGPGV